MCNILSQYDYIRGAEARLTDGKHYPWRYDPYLWSGDFQTATCTCWPCLELSLAAWLIRTVFEQRQLGRGSEWQALGHSSNTRVKTLWYWPICAGGFALNVSMFFSYNTLIPPLFSLRDTGLFMLQKCWCNFISNSAYLFNHHVWTRLRHIHLTAW